MAWNDQGGGFDTSPSVDASPSVARERGHEEKNGFKPLCIKSILRAAVEDQFVSADGGRLHQVSLVAKVLQADMNNQRCDYLIGDHTGAKIQVKEYINDDEVVQPEPIPQGEYVRVYGALKSFQGEPNIVATKVVKIKDPNEITMHLLEMTHTYLKMKQVGESGTSGSVDKTAEESDQVRTVIQGNRSMAGISISDIKAALPHIPPDQIQKHINYLSGEGFIFSTIDDDHFRATEDA